MECLKCGYKTENKKSFSNHIRYDCNNKFDIIECNCKYCGNKMPNRKPSEHGYFCNRICYSKYREIHFTKENSTNYKTGESRTRLYAIWLGMKRRCLKPNCKDYKNYGGRGILICESWLNSFLIFKEWATNNGYKENLTIERNNVNGNYEPNNCSWITISEQFKNKRNAKNN